MVWLVCVASACALGTSLGQQAAKPATAQQSWASVVGVDIAPEDDPAERVDTRPTLKISLEDCILRALKNNYNIAIERLKPQMASLDVTIEQAGFDTRIQSKASASKSSIPTRSQIQYGEGGATKANKSNNKQLALSGGLAKKIISGADLGLSLDTRRDDNIVSKSTTNPYYSTDLTLSVAQPMLRNGWLSYNRNPIRIANNSRKVSVWAFKSSVMEKLAEVQNAYWNLIRAIDNLRVSRESLHRAKRLYETNKIQVRAGTMAPIEVLQAQAEVASQRGDVIVGQKAVRDREDELKRLMNMRDEHGRLSDRRLAPTSQPVFTPIKVDRQICFRQARLNRPEYYMTELELRNELLRLQQAKNQLLPKLDMTGKFTWHGRGNGYGNAFDQMAGDSQNFPRHIQYYSASLGLTLEYPIGNRAAKSRYLKSRLRVTQRRLERELMDLRIQEQVRGAVRGVQTNIERVKANRVATVLARERLRAEEKKFSVGKSTSFDVLDAQEDLAIAERNEVRAIIDYRISLVALERMKGTILDTCNVFVSGQD